MKEFFMGGLFGTLAGICVGGIIVSKNKKLSNKISDSITKIEQKFEKAKDCAKEKLEECKGSDSNSNCCC